MASLRKPLGTNLDAVSFAGLTPVAPVIYPASVAELEVGNERLPRRDRDDATFVDRHLLEDDSKSLFGSDGNAYAEPTSQR